MAPQPFKVYGQKIEIVENLFYLGFELNSNSTFVAAIERLHSKFYRACMNIRERLHLYDGVTVPKMTKLLDSMVKSIAIYRCEIWGLYGWKKNHFRSIKNYLLFKDHKFEKPLCKFYKQIFGIDKQIPDILQTNIWH